MDIQEIYHDKAKELQALIQNSLMISPLLQPPHFRTEEKYEKHLKDSDPILSNVLSPFAAFQDGFERAIASYIKLGQEENIKNKVISQQQPKSEETQILENLIKSLLKDFDSVKFIKKEHRYLAIADGKLYQFSTILERVNFNDIELDSTELNAYHQYLDSGRLFQKPHLSSQNRRPTEEDFEELDSENLCRALTFAEKEALNIYTGNSYAAMNNLMRGKIDEAIDCLYIPDIFTPSGKVNHCIKEILLHIGVAISGLNKLPDYTPPSGSDGQPIKYLYRAENHLPEDILKKRKWAALNGQGITMEMGFISTAFEKPAQGFFGEHSQAGLMIKNLKGKKITPLSQFGNNEREILLPPTQMQWLYSKDIVTDVYKNQLALFIAKPVSVPLDLTLDYVPRSAEEWIVRTIEPKDNLLWEIDTAMV
jgi:hypothetical protein